MFDGDDAERLDSLGDRPSRLRGSMLLWIDLADLSESSLREVASEFGLDEESVERLIDPSQGVGFLDRSEHIHVTASTPDVDEDDRQARSNASSVTTG
jgi:Mg2+ and Co2+ transporter CorA